MATPKRNMLFWNDLETLISKHEPFDLGKGNPDFFPPQYVCDALVETALENDYSISQYTRGWGHPRLVRALANLFSPLLNHEINANKEIIISIGASGSLYNACQALIKPGDEVIIMEPFFLTYESLIRDPGGVPVYVPLKPVSTDKAHTSSGWTFDKVELSSKFTKKTKLMLFNNPNNPLGKVYTRQEMDVVADLCKKHNVICLSDEVYEWLTYGSQKHIRMASLPDMWQRTITVGSAGKTFSATGWKTGWGIGPVHLISAMGRIHSGSLFHCPTPLQEAAARCIEKETPRLNTSECYFNAFPLQIRQRRHQMAKLLTDVGFKPIIPDGGYFMLADFSKYDKDVEDASEGTKDEKFVKWLIVKKGLSVFPVSRFFSSENQHIGENYVRFCIIKDESTLHQAEIFFQQWNTT